jgi:hypothetical protein
MLSANPAIAELSDGGANDGVVPERCDPGSRNRGRLWDIECLR